MPSISVHIQKRRLTGLIIYFTIAGFYLGYLRGRIFPPYAQTPSPAPKKKNFVSITVTVSEKSSRRDEVSAHTVTVLKILSQNSPVASQHIFKSGGGMSPDLPRKFVPLGH